MKAVGARGVMQREVGWILKAEIVAPERTAPMAVSLNIIVVYALSSFNDNIIRHFRFLMNRGPPLPLVECLRLFAVGGYRTYWYNRSVLIGWLTQLYLQCKDLKY